jgi:hypothetical protein
MRNLHTLTLLETIPVPPVTPGTTLDELLRQIACDPVPPPEYPGDLPAVKSEGIPAFNAILFEMCDVGLTPEDLRGVLAARGLSPAGLARTAAVLATDPTLLPAMDTALCIEPSPPVTGPESRLSLWDQGRGLMLLAGHPGEVLLGRNMFFAFRNE